MHKDDYMVRALAANGHLRAFALDTTNLTDEARKRHDLYPIAAAALGRTMTVGLVLGKMLKSGSVTIQIKADGLLKGILVSADYKGNIRGYVGNPHVHLPLNIKGKLSVGEALGKGTLHVIKDMNLKEPYRGTIPLQTGEIGEDFAYYLRYSEQTPSVVSVGVTVNADHSVQAAGGFVIQVLPGADESITDKLEQRIAHIPHISSLIRKGKKPEEILHMILADMDLNIMEKEPVKFSCFCSKERFEKGLATLSEKELNEIIVEDEEAELICHFCQNRYYYNKDELMNILTARKEEGHND